LPLGDLGVPSIDVLLSKLPHEYTVDRFSKNGELNVLQIIYGGYYTSVFCNSCQLRSSGVISFHLLCVAVAR